MDSSNSTTNFISENHFLKDYSKTKILVDTMQNFIGTKGYLKEIKNIIEIEYPQHNEKCKKHSCKISKEFIQGKIQRVILFEFFSHSLKKYGCVT